MAAMSSDEQNLRAVVVLPTYNNERTLGDVMSRVAALGVPIIVVNDGCTDQTAALLERWRAEHPQTQVQVHVHPHNRGKAAALQSGFALAMDDGFTHAVTVDTDGQHDPEEIPALLAEARKNPAAYVLGYRDDTRADYPARSRLGRRLSNFFIRLECGLRVRDSQCGMRIYPLDLVRTVRCRAGHFGYEAEMITRAAWSGCPIAEVPIVTRYLPPGQRVSHFRPWLDTLRGIGMHVRLLVRALIPWPHARLQRGAIQNPAKGKPLILPRGDRSGLPFSEEKSNEQTQGVRPRIRRSLRNVWRWISPVDAWREMRKGTLSRSEISAALALGVFIGNLPAYGVQTVMALYAARRLHLHPLLVVSGSHISIPPVAPFLIAAAIACGHLLLHGALPMWPGMQAFHADWKSIAGAWLLDWIVGGLVMGCTLGLIVFILSQMLLWLTVGRSEPIADVR